jgi:hypothetical protein
MDYRVSWSDFRRSSAALALALAPAPAVVGETAADG